MLCEHLDVHILACLQQPFLDPLSVLTSSAAIPTAQTKPLVQPKVKVDVSMSAACFCSLCFHLFLMCLTVNTRRNDKCTISLHRDPLLLVIVFCCRCKFEFFEADAVLKKHKQRIGQGGFIFNFWSWAEDT